MTHRDETTLWTCQQGIRCVLLPYDETRYQLRLVRELGTIKADLFAGYANAIAASQMWRAELSRKYPDDDFVLTHHPRN